MASRDDFPEEFEAAVKHRNLIVSELSERDRLKELKQSTAKIEARLRNAVQKFAVSVDSLLGILKDYQLHPTRYRVNDKELQLRKGKVNDLENELTVLDERIRASPKIEMTSGIGANFKREGGVGESEDTRHFSNAELKQARRDMYSKQIELEEALLGTTENLLDTAKGIGDEVAIHNELLDAVDHNVEHQTTKMQRTKFRMEELVYKSNDNCMIICIVVLIVVLVLLIAL
jgi:hypothetical protein